MPESEGNFVWPATEKALTVFEEAGLLVRLFLNEGIRVTIADRISDDRFLEAALQVRQLGLPAR